MAREKGSRNQGSVELDKKIAALKKQGLVNRDVAEKLELSESVVKNRVTKMCDVKRIRAVKMKPKPVPVKMVNWDSCCPITGLPLSDSTRPSKHQARIYRIAI